MLTIESINAINEQYLKRMNEIEAMKVQVESKAQKFARNARELLDNMATIVHCPNDDCYSGYTITYCNCLNDPKCLRCYGKGVVEDRCPTCKGEGEVLMHTDGRIEVLV